MKFIIITIAFICNSILSNAQIITAEISALGLTCSMCSRTTYSKLITIAGVEKITTNLNNTSFLLHMKKDAKVDVNQFKDKVESAGYTVGGLVLSIDASKISAINNETFIIDNNLFKWINTKPTNTKGEIKVKVLGKGFLSTKEYKELVKSNPIIKQNASILFIKPV